MADVVHSSRSYTRSYRCRAGAEPVKGYYESTAASTAVIGFGQVVQFDQTDSAAHRIRRASTAIGAAPFLGANVVGVSASASVSDGSTASLDTETRRISVWEASLNAEFLFPTKLVIASTLVNTGLELSYDSTLGIHHLSANSTAGDLTVRVTEVLAGTVGDTGGWLAGRFFSSVVAPSVSGL